MPSLEAPTRYLRRPVARARSVTIFLSSGSDLGAQRDHFEELVRVVNEQLAAACGPEQDPLYIHVQRWENDAPKRTDGDPNRAFREKAAKAHVTVVLLWNDIRAGTKEEIREALKEPDVQISAIWFKPEKPRSAPTKQLQTYLDRKKKGFIWDPNGPPGTVESTVPMMKIIARTLADVWAADAAGTSGEGAFHERRSLESTEGT